MHPREVQVIRETLERTEGQSNDQRAEAIARALFEARLPRRVPVGGIITPQ